jgi:hypothetical protein
MSTAAEMYELYVNAEKKILMGQSVKFGDRILTRADLAEVRKGRSEWERKVINKKSNGASHSLARF